MTTNTTNKAKRLVSLDAFRGFTIAAMIVVNTPGSWDSVFPPLLHAQWNGLTPTDLIFPFFLFMVGISIVLAYSRKINTSNRSTIITQLLKRSLILFLLGVLLNAIGSGFTEIRLPGVLQRIALAFLAGSLLFIYTSKKTQIYTGVSILISYWLMMKYIPIPEFGAGILEPGKNLANYLDSIIIPFKMYQGTWDPEGLLSTLPSIATTITGMFTGYILLAKENNNAKIYKIVVSGFIMLICGVLVNWSFPINKNLWSSSYVLCTSGLANLALASIYYIMDVKLIVNWGKIGIIWGTNAISAYIIHYILMIPFVQFKFDNMSIQNHFMHKAIAAGIMPELASFAWAILYSSLCFIPIYILYRKKIFIKI